MLRLLSDENFNEAIVRGLFRHHPELDLIRVEDAGRRGLDDPSLLAWAAEEGRILLTHDRNTMPGYAYERVVAGFPMTGVLIVRDTLPIGQAIADIELVMECCTADECRDRVLFLPL